jgi:prophage regulatory protein
VRILRRKATQEKTGLCRSSLYELEAAGLFPKRVQLGPRSVGFLEHEVISGSRSASRHRAGVSDASLGPEALRPVLSVTLCTSWHILKRPARPDTS